jgi:hypothetical protein
LRRCRGGRPPQHRQPDRCYQLAHMLDKKLSLR